MTKLKLNELDSTVKSSYRTLAIFEFFAEIRRPATVAEVSQGLQIPQSSASVILKSLLDISYLSFDTKKRTYEPTMRLAFSSHWNCVKNSNAANLPALMEKLRDDVNETVVLAMRNGIYSQYIMVAHYGDVIASHVEIGSVRPLIYSATGWSLLKEETDVNVSKIIRRTRNEICGPAWGIPVETVVENIRRSRKSIFAVSKGETANKAAGIAVNLPANGRGARLSVAVAGPIDRILKNEKSIQTHLKSFVGKLPMNITEETLNS